MFGVKKFHQCLFGCHFTILSDHKPLQHLFSEAKGIPTMASAQIQRWVMALGAHDYSVKDSMITLTSWVIYHFQTLLQMFQPLKNLSY